MTQPSYEPPQYGQQQPGYGQPLQPYGQPQQPGYAPPDHTQQLPQYSQPFGAAAPTSGNPYGGPISGQPFGAQQPVASGKTNGFAVASLIFGIIGGILLSVIFGIVALSQIKKRGDNGKGMAVTGLVLSGVWTVLLCILGVVFLVVAANADDPDLTSGTNPSTGQSQSVPQAQSTKETMTKLENLKAGQCVNGIVDSSGGTMSRLPVIACTQPHEGEVVSIFNLTGGSTYPGDSAVEKQSEDKCFDELDRYSPSTKDDQTINIFYLQPTKQTWAAGDRTVICMALFEKEKRVGSIKG